MKLQTYRQHFTFTMITLFCGWILYIKQQECYVSKVIIYFANLVTDILNVKCNTIYTVLYFPLSQLVPQCGTI